MTQCSLNSDVLHLFRSHYRAKKLTKLSKVYYYFNHTNKERVLKYWKENNVYFPYPNKCKRMDLLTEKSFKMEDYRFLAVKEEVNIHSTRREFKISKMEGPVSS